VIVNATVPIYYESRIAKLSLNESELPKVDSEFEEITEGDEGDRKQKLKTKWAALEALVGSEKRIRLIAEDLVQHFERRLEAMDGKAMVVCMSRRICVDIYNELIKLHPDWASAKDDDLDVEKKQPTVVKIVMTGSASDVLEWQPIRKSEGRRKKEECDSVPFYPSSLCVPRSGNWSPRPSLPKTRLSTCSPQRDSSDRTSRSCLRSSSPKCAA
jgi:type I restriction enzyme R subunit